MSSDVESRTTNTVENKTKQRKEKKKKKKVADILEYPGTQSESVEEKEKTNSPENLVEPGTTPHNPGAKEKKKRNRDREDHESPSAERTKKRKKENVSVVTSCVAHPSEATGVNTTTSEVKERKKRGKSKSRETLDPHASTTGSAPITSSTGELETPRKRKPTRGGAMDDSSILSEGRSTRKWKKSKQLIHLDPSDDLDLTEQSQKALVYIYSHSTSLETWKFNKARQNWVVRNVWTSKVPEKYLPMAVEYLSRVQGQVRETLIESCKTIISGSNSEPDTEAVTNGNGPSDSANPPSTNTVHERRKWAEILLFALTSKS